MRKYLPLMAILIPALCLCVVVVYFLPPVHDRLAWRVDEAVLRLRYSLNPPAQQVFVPQEGLAAPATQVTALPSATSTLPPFTPTATQADPVSTPAPSPTPSATPLPLPPSVDLKGVVYEDQHGRWNYCAPANLAMALSFWGWQGNRDVVGPALKAGRKRQERHAVRDGRLYPDPDGPEGV